MDDARRKWERVRDAARAAWKPDGFVLATSFSSAQPMVGWELPHAIRELWQNMRDGLTRAFGGAILVPTVGPTSTELRVSALPDPLVGSIAYDNPDTLVLRQRFAVLEVKHLLLASSKQSASDDDAAGCHGEGLRWR